MEDERIPSGQIALGEDIWAYVCAPLYSPNQLGFTQDPLKVNTGAARGESGAKITSEHIMACHEGTWHPLGSSY